MDELVQNNFLYYNVKDVIKINRLRVLGCKNVVVPIN